MTRKINTAGEAVVHTHDVLRHDMDVTAQPQIRVAGANLLDRPLLSLLNMNWETLAWVIIFVVGAVARFYNLGVRAMSHDESLHALYSYYLYDAGNYEHNPMMHGPLLFHINALVYFLFGDSDTTARLAPRLQVSLCSGWPICTGDILDGSERSPRVFCLRLARVYCSIAVIFGMTFTSRFSP